MIDCSVDLYNKICNDINKNPLPVSIKYFIVKDIFNEIDMAYKQYLVFLNNEENKEEEETCEEEVKEE